MTITVISERETVLESEITELKEERAELEHNLHLLQLDSDLARTGAGLVNQKLCREINKLEKKNDALKAELAALQNQEPAGPLVTGWQITLSNGHSGYGAYAHMTEYPEEGAVFLAAGAKEKT